MQERKLKKSIMENSQENFKKIFYDFECFIHDWLVVFIDYDTREKTVIVNNRQKLQDFYDLHKNDIFCGYNSRTYDQVMFKAILQGLDPWEVNDQIINQGKKEYQILDKNNKIPFNNYDCILLNKSLKQLEGFLNVQIKESDIPFDIDRKLTQEEIKETIYYCTHDVESTIEVYENTKEEFDAKLGLVEEFNLPMSSFGKTKAQLVAEILGAERNSYDGDEFDLIIPDTLMLSEKYKHIADWYMDRKNHNYSRKLCVDVAGVPHVFGYGGIHGALPNYSYEGIILACDVASLYPSIIIEYNLMSRAVKSVEKYKEIRDTRFKYKKAKDPRQYPLKIVLNSCYGTFKDKYNNLYDPRQSNNVCLTGQLLLLDLIEKLEPYITLIQSNTDGLFFAVKDKETIEKCKKVAREWEIRTRLNLEWEEYVKIVQKDVNNFIMIDKDGHYKSKGAWLKKLSKIDSDLLILNKSLIDYFLKDVPIRETIMLSNSLADFQKIVKVSSLYMYAMLGEEKIKEKVLRVFASKNENAPMVYKVKTEGRLEKIGNTPEHCFIFNDDIQNAEIPEELDREYYIKEAESRLNDFYSSDRKSTIKAKSEIKGVNEEVYNDILNLDLDEFGSFVDFLVFCCQNGKANKTQLGILTKLNFFEKFGKNKKLNYVLNNFYNGEFKFSKNYSDKKKNQIISALKEIESKAKNEEFSIRENIEIRNKYLGYFITKKESDRPILIVEKIQDAKRKSDGRKFGKRIKCISYGSGKESWYTIFSRDYNKHGELTENSVLLCLKFSKSGEFYNINSYKILE